MIDPIDLTITGALASRNKLDITEPTALASAVADFTAFRLAELQTSPICGGFDSAHLQDIHRHLFQDIYEWAGELRGTGAGDLGASRLEKSLNSVFDQLARENHLKGFSLEEWAQKASGYTYDIGVLQPFLAGNELALREFAAELARKNDLSLHWGTDPSVANALHQLQQEEQAANIRRIIMLAMDTNSGLQLPGRGTITERGAERLLSLEISHL
jgi:fido (protein-threonine AMPylation protein)